MASEREGKPVDESKIGEQPCFDPDLVYGESRVEYKSCDLDRKKLSLEVCESPKIDTILNNVDDEYFDTYVIPYVRNTPKESQSYLENLKTLQRIGVKIDENFISDLTSEKGNNEEYIQSLIVLHNEAGARIDGYFVHCLDLEKGVDEKYIQVLVDLRNMAGIKVDWATVSNLSFEMANDKKYIQALVNLSVAGVDMDGTFFGNEDFSKMVSEKGNDEEYVQVLKMLCDDGIKVNDIFIYKLSLEKAKNSGYMRILRELLSHNGNHFISSYFLEIENLDQFMYVIRTVPKEFPELNLSTEEIVNIAYGIDVLGLRNVRKMIEQRHIYYFLRYTEQELARQIYQVYPHGNSQSRLLKKEELEQQAKKPVMLIVYNHSDWNGAFYQNQDKFNYLSENFNVVLYEAENEQDFYDAVHDTSEDFGQITHLQIGGHGSRSSIRIGSSRGIHQEDETNFLDLNDEEISWLWPFLRDSVIILESCSTGVDENAIGGVIHSVSWARKLFAPKIPTSIKDWKIEIIDGKPEIVGVDYYRGGVGSVFSKKEVAKRRRKSI